MKGSWIEPLGLGVNILHDPGGGERVTLGNVIANGGKLPQGASRPNDLHGLSGTIVFIERGGDLFLSGKIAPIGILDPSLDASDPFFLSS